MDDALYYLSINRQRGLSTELAAIANNIANVDTAGFRKEEMIFSEYVRSTGTGESISMANMGTRFASTSQGEMRITGGTLDLALEGPGYFLTAGAEGTRLTRAGVLQQNDEGVIVTPQGAALLDEGEAPIFLPPDAGSVTVAADGTISADGVPLARIAVVEAAPESLVRTGTSAFAPTAGYTPLESPKIRQGAIERSNVDPVEEIARMISVTRAYEQVQNLIRDEDERIRDAIQTLGQPV